MIKYKNIKIVFLLVMSGWLLFSCSSSRNTLDSSWLTKRKYRPGYHIDLPFLSPDPGRTTGQDTMPPLMAQVSPSPPVSLGEAARDTPTTASPDTSQTIKCALMTLKNGEDRLVKVKEIKEKHVYYQSCKTLSDSILSIPTYKVLLIRYRDGSKDIFNEAAPPDTSVRPPDTTSRSTTDSHSPKNVEVEKTESSQQPRTLDGFSIASTLLSAGSLISIILLLATGGSTFFLTWFFGSIFAIISGIIGLTRFDKGNRLKGKGYAMFGLFLGILDLILFILLIILFIMALSSI